MRALALAILGSLNAAVPVAGAAEPYTVVLKSFAFAPATLRVPVGASVRWLNRDEEPHNVLNLEGKFHSNAMDTDEAFSYVFTAPGTYHYICTIHHQMSGVIIVGAAP